MVRLFGGAPPPECDFRCGRRARPRAIRAERAMLLSARPVDLVEYESASLDKQCAGILASVALARAAGWTERRCRAVRATLEIGVARPPNRRRRRRLGRRRPAGWRVGRLLDEGAGHAFQHPGQGVHPRPGAPVGRPGCHAPARLRAHARGASSRRRARGPPTGLLGRSSKKTVLEGLAAAETRSAGYAVRAHALAAWASEVLA